MASPAERRQAATYCPGMNHGPLVNLTLARQLAAQVQQAFPQLYDEPEIPGEPEPCDENKQP